MTRRTCLAACLVMAVGFLSPSRTAAAPPCLWVYAPVNFQVDKEADRLVALLERAAKAGYTGAVITDYKFGHIEDRPENYYRNMRRVRQAAERLGVELIPCVMPVGYSNSILMNDPNLAEGIPVKDCPLAVADGRAVVADADELLPGGAFEQADRKVPAGWDWVDGWNVSVSLDRQEKHGGACSLRMRDFGRGNETANCRIVRQVAVRPWRQYALSLWIRTRGVQPAGDVRVTILAGQGRSLNFTNLGVKPDQDWTRHDIVFNSLEHEQIRLYIGIWGGRAGTLWIDDATLKPVAGINLLRRDGCPVRLTGEDGKTEYAEGKDYQRWEYPRMGREPWPGEYKVWHPQPPVVLTADSRIRPDQRLLVSYYHTVTIYDGQVACCLVSNEVFKHLRRQVEQVHEYFAPRTYFMQHDEIRLAGHCGLCRATGKTAGQLLADNAHRCVETIRQVNPKAEVAVWSDMFDPHHNARDGYYLVASTLEGSWEGLDRSVVIANWNGGKRKDSLAFFAGRGHAQVIAGYYDHPNVAAEADKWRAAASGVSGVRGYMYTTWRNNYADMERFAEAVRGK